MEKRYKEFKRKKRRKTEREKERGIDRQTSSEVIKTSKKKKKVHTCRDI